MGTTWSAKISKPEAADQFPHGQVVAPGQVHRHLWAPERFPALYSSAGQIAVEWRRRSR